MRRMQVMVAFGHRVPGVRAAQTCVCFPQSNHTTKPPLLQ